VKKLFTAELSITCQVV